MSVEESNGIDSFGQDVLNALRLVTLDDLSASSIEATIQGYKGLLTQLEKRGLEDRDSDLLGIGMDGMTTLAAKLDIIELIKSGIKPKGDIISILGISSTIRSLAQLYGGDFHPSLFPLGAFVQKVDSLGTQSSVSSVPGTFVTRVQNLLEHDKIK